MKLQKLLFAVLLCVSAASAADLGKVFLDLHKQSIETLLNVHEKVLSDHQRLLLNKELQTRERHMTYEQKNRFYGHPSQNRAKGKAYGKKHAPGQLKKHH
jgi:hypothetical protein